MRPGVYWHIFPTYGEAKDAVWRDPNMLFNIIPEQLITKRNEAELVIYLKNGSLIQLKGADNPDTLRGSGPYGMVLDEFADMKPDTWGIVEPIIRANGGWCWFVGTPRGKNHLFEMYQRGQQGHTEWYSERLRASASGIIPFDQLEESKKTMSQALFNQEWECEFLEGEGSVFRNVRETMINQVPRKPQAEHMYVLGADLAKHQDYTVLSVFDRTTNCQVYQDRFNKLDWGFVKLKIKETALHYNNALVVLDATGLGDPIYDDLVRVGVGVEPIKFTEQMKNDLVEKLSIYIEQKRIHLLPIQETMFEYDNFSYEIGPTGKVRYGARLGFHDDIIMSHALAIWSLQPLFSEPREKSKSRIQLALESAQYEYEQTYGDSSDGDWSEWASE